jgi:hypothetical protein
MKNAIGAKQCGTCRYWHNPHEQQAGVCIFNPPTPFIVGVVPSSPLVDPRKPGADMAHVIRGYFPLVGREDGCAKHAPDVGALN